MSTTKKKSKLSMELSVPLSSLQFIGSPVGVLKEHHAWPSSSGADNPMMGEPERNDVDRRLSCRFSRRMEEAWDN